ncbi:MAG: helix-turn-helix domain-containing protein [Elusimicrobiota bacterium]
MITKKIKELESLRSKAADLQSQIESERKSELAILPHEYGYDSLKEFIKALKAAAGSRRKGRGRKMTSKKAASKSGKRTYTKITPVMKAKVIAAVKADKTGSAIVKEFGLSLPSVQNIKKAAGLVKKRVLVAA